MKDFLWIFYCISEMCMQFRTFWKKRWVSLPNYFRNYGLRKRWLLKRLKRSCFRRPCGNQRVNGFQTLLKSTRHHYYPIFPCIWDILSWKKSALVWSEILTLFVNTLTAHNKYSRCNVHNFAQQLQTSLSQKWKTFCEFFIAFLKFACILEHFEKKDEYPSLIFSGIMDCERDGYLNV